MGDDAVKVAVRVRPFNNRELQMGAKNILKMNGGTTIITDPSGQPREFTFDYSYWSFDKNDENFVDNVRVFNDLGNTVLQNAWEGYNVCLFAYGQTGAGKSYSMVGYGNDRGIVPLALEEMFERIKRSTDPNIKYQVEASMMEIYNEKVRDLFNPDNNPPTGLKVRDHPKLGPYVEDLSSCPVTNYAEVEKLMAEGTAARTVAATQMNNSSSRAHTIFQIMLTTTTHDVTTNKDTSKVSKINLVDLAGSERVAKTGATGQQMKEGININKSLSVLGDCIEKLAKRAKDKGVHVPYRNSVLTWLLKQSLGGNSKTIMIAALSPADDNYDETLSTLRYADRAKQICNQAVVNEDENAKIIRSLRKEIEALKAQLTGGAPVSLDATAGGGVMSDEERKKREEEREEFERMKERMKQNEEIMKRMNMTWEEKMKEASAAADKRSKVAAANTEQRKTTPHLVNLHQDMLLAETLTHFFPEGTIRICRQDIEPPPGPDDIVLKGLLVQKENAEVTNTSSSEGKVIVDPKPDARIFINGILIKEPTELTHNDRVIIGAHHVFRFVHPLHAPQLDENAESDSEKYNWQFAQKELTEAAMSSLAPIVDDETKKQQEESQRKMKELEEQIAAEKEASLQAQLAKQKEFEEMMRAISEQKEKEFAEAREKLSQEADAKTQAELQAVLEAKQRDLENEKLLAQQEFQRQQAEMAKAQAELEKKLAEQQKITETLQRKKEIENRDKVLLEESLMRTIPMVNEANAMCDELKQNLRFQIKLMAKKSTDANAFTEKTQVFVKVHDVSEGLEVFWDNEAFNENLFLMREIYNAYQDEGVLRLTDENNPFHIQCDGPQLIGNCRIYLQPVYYLFPIDEKTPIIDYKGEAQGQLSVKLLPIPNKDPESDAEDGAKGKEKDGKTEEEEYFFDEENVEELKGQLLEMRLEISKAMGLPQKFSSQVHCVYKFFLDEKELRTKATEESSINPTIGYSRTIIIDPVTDDFVEYLKSGLMEVQLWGQRPTDEQKKAEDHRRRQGSIITDQDRAELEEVKKALLSLDIPTHARGMSVSQQVNSLVTSLKTRVDSPEPLSPMVYGNFDDSPMPTKKSFNFGSGRASPDDSAVSYETKDGSLAPMVTVSPPQPDPVLVKQLEQKGQALAELQQKVEQQAQELERLRSEHTSYHTDAPNSSEAMASKVALEKQIRDLQAEQAKLSQREAEWAMEKARLEAMQQEKERQWAVEREKYQRLQSPAPAGPDAKPAAVEISKELQYELEKLRNANLALLRANQDMQAKLATQKESKSCVIL